VLSYFLAKIIFALRMLAALYIPNNGMWHLIYRSLNFSRE